MTPLRSRLFSSPLEEKVRAFAAMPPAWRGTVRGNLLGAILSAVVTLPMSMGLGALAFSPFGPEFVTRGVLAALYSVAFMGLVAILVGARGAAIYAPRSLVAFMIASVAAGLFLKAPWLPPGPDALEAAILLTLALAGLFQLCFGLARFAKVVKFIPTPVMAGFQNSASLVVMLSQLPVMLGIASHSHSGPWRTVLAEVRPMSVLVAAATLALVMRGGRITKRLPPLVLGLAGGTIAYHVLAFAGFATLLGPTLGSIPVAIPDGHELANIVSLTLAPGFTEALPAILAGAMSIAVVSSLDVLINAKIVENVTRRRGNATQELINVGSANLVTPLLGGISGSISLASTTTAVRGGATNSLALLFHALIFLVMIPLVAPILGHIPRAVIGALVFYAGMLLFDRWSLELAKRIVALKSVQWRGIFVDLAVIVVVAGIALAGEIMAAVLLGVTIAVVVFMLRMSRSVIRRERFGDALNSRRARDASDGALLASHGRAILALELEGPLFFASAELLFNRVDAAPAEGVRYVILDLSRVTELDSTGAKILLQADERLRAAKCRLVLCGAGARPELLSLLIDHGATEVFTHERMFRDLDHALERCENELLGSLRSSVAAGEYPFERLDLLRNIGGADREALRSVLARREYTPGEVVFGQGDEGDALYVIASGSASVWLRDPGSGE
ncbi:MAG TPA: SulP family inorganic anion transporter, partial [Usitatibacter sp.]|nr:SulP family inorganic anion transporter [Usitatibacter sp.]